MTHRTTWRYGAALAGAALVLSGCGAFEDETPAERENLSSAFGIDDGSDTDWRAQELQVEELIALCMQEKGWEYIPVQYPEEWYNYEWDPAQERERIEREGFGIAYWVLYPDAMDEFNPGIDFVDPNQAYIETLSQTEMDAYYLDLYGDMMFFPEPYYDEISGEYIEPMPDEGGFDGGNTTAGCQTEAWEEVNPGQGNEETWEAMSEFYDEIYARVEADPRIIALNEDWVQCMTDNGHDYQSQDDFWMRGWDELYERFEEIVPSNFIDPMDGWTEQQMNDFFENATDADWEALYGNPYGDITPDQRAQLEDLLADEIDLALAEHDCSSGHWDKYAEISAEVEENYIRENRAAIDEAAANARG